MKRKKILVVEDEQTTRRMLTFNLRQQGYDIYEAEDGNIALQMIAADTPDLILLDIMMPGENGFEVIKKIRANSNISEVIIIVLTARAGLADKKFAFTAGADDYLTKPINLHDLNARIEHFIGPGAEQPVKEQPLSAGQIVGIFGPQRKMGATTLAINLGKSIASQGKNPVVLVDLVLPVGDVAPTIGLNANKNIAHLLSLPTVQITPETIALYLQTLKPNYRIIAAPAGITGPDYRPTSDNLLQLLNSLVETGHIVVLDLGSSLTELSLTAIRRADKVFVLTSGLPAANEALDNFLILARKLGLDLARLLPVINQLNGPVGSNIVLVRSPIARVPYLQIQSESSWANELALQKLSTFITT